MDWDVVACVLGEDVANLSMQSCHLDGYRVARLPHEDYPMLVEHPHTSAPGQLLQGLTAKQLDRVIFYEGEEYEISPCEVRLASGAMAKALFFSEGIMPEPQMTDWCFETWRAQHKAYLLRQSAAYMAWYGKLPAAEADYYWQTYTEDETLVTLKAAG